MEADIQSRVETLENINTRIISCKVDVKSHSKTPFEQVSYLAPMRITA